jgi:hypothetical protein
MTIHRMEKTDTRIQDPSVAHTEANVITEIGKIGDGRRTIAEQIIDTIVDPKYKPALQDTAKIDINAQIYEGLEQKSPEVVEAMKARSDALAKITAYYATDYINGLVGSHANRVKEAAKRPYEEQEKAWQSSRENMEGIVRSIATEMKNLKERHDLPFYKAFSETLEGWIEAHRIDKHDEIIFGEFYTAAVATIEITRRDSLKGATKEAAIGVNVNSAYQKQMEYDKNSSK